MTKHGLDNGGVLDSGVVEGFNQALNDPSGQGSWDLQHISDQRGQRTSLMALLRNAHPQFHLHRVVVTHFLCLQRDGATVKASVLFTWGVERQLNQPGSQLVFSPANKVVGRRRGK